MHSTTLSMCEHPPLLPPDDREGFFSALSSMSLTRMGCQAMVYLRMRLANQRRTPQVRSRMSGLQHPVL